MITFPFAKPCRQTPETDLLLGKEKAQPDHPYLGDLLWQ